jgi:hypothetical protein
MAFGIPSTGGGKPLNHLPGQGAFAIPTNVQRIAEQGLWSSFRFPAGTSISGTNPRFFSVQLGAQGQGFLSPMSFSETNQQVANQCPGDETYEISAIAAEILGAPGVEASVGDIRLFQRLGCLRWEFGSVLIDVSPLSMIGAGGGVFGATANTALGTTFANSGNGGLWLYTGVVIAVPSTQRFAQILAMGTGGQSAALAPVSETQIRITLFNMSRVAVPIA